MMHQAITTELERQHMAHKARRALWRAKASLVHIEPQKLQKPVLHPLWKRRCLRFDDHVTRWQVSIIRSKASPCRTYIRQRCNDLGVRYADIMGPERFKSMTDARQLIMWELYRTFDPHPSLSEIGRVMGRDHTSVLHAVQKIDRLKAEGLMP